MVLQSQVSRATEPLYRTNHSAEVQGSKRQTLGPFKAQVGSTTCTCSRCRTAVGPGWPVDTVLSSKQSKQPAGHGQRVPCRDAPEPPLRAPPTESRPVSQAQAGELPASGLTGCTRAPADLPSLGRVGGPVVRAETQLDAFRPAAGQQPSKVLCWACRRSEGAGDWEDGVGRCLQINVLHRWRAAGAGVPRAGGFSCAQVAQISWLQAKKQQPPQAARICRAPPLVSPHSAAHLLADAR